MPIEVAYWGPPLSGRSSNLRMLAAQLGGEVTHEHGVLRLSARSSAGEVVAKSIESPLYDEEQYVTFTRAADAFVVVVDAQRWQMEANRFYLALLDRFLHQSGRSLAEVPLVVQVNKSDLENSIEPEELLASLGLQGIPFVIAVAESGTGVEATLDAAIARIAERSLVVDRDRYDVRLASAEDAAALLDLQLSLDEETHLMMLEPDERSHSVDARRRSLRELLAAPNSALFVICDGSALVGMIEARGGSFRRNRHVAEVVVGVRRSHAGQGLARRLFNTLEEWARRNEVTRLEFTVMMHNDRAVRLYQRAGFTIEGTKRRSLKVDGQWVDEYLMAKLLD